MLKCLYADRKQQRLGPEHDRSGNIQKNVSQLLL
jgi:hypothetical protein